MTGILQLSITSQTNDMMEGNVVSIRNDGCLPFDQMGICIMLLGGY